MSDPESQPPGVFIPDALPRDTRLKPAEHNAWIKFRSLANKTVLPP
ncbi:MAG: hypothetical protein LBI87_05800 [Candidatus Accumulibacter sp.]|nr:hypothetical protein [Accumulibacter sp.]